MTCPIYTENVMEILSNIFGIVSTRNKQTKKKQRWKYSFRRSTEVNEPRHYIKHYIGCFSQIGAKSYIFRQMRDNHIFQYIVWSADVSCLPCLKYDVTQVAFGIMKTGRIIPELKCSANINWIGHMPQAPTSADRNIWLDITCCKIPKNACL